MRGRGLRGRARGTVVALLLRWPFPPRPRPRHCSLVRPVPAILVRLLVVVVVYSLSLSSFVPPPPHLVLIALWSSPLLSLLLFHQGPRPRPSYRCLVLVPVVILGPPSPTSLVRPRSTLRAGAHSGVAGAGSASSSALLVNT